MTLFRPSGSSWRASFAAVCLIAHAAARPTAAQTQRLVGAVVDKKASSPVSGTKVSLLDATGRVLESVITDHAGRFAFGLKAPGVYGLFYSRFGYVSAKDWRAISVLTPRDTLLASAKIAADNVLADAMSTPASKAMAGYYYETRLALAPATFITKDSIAAKHYESVGAAVASLPNVQVKGDDKHKWSVALAPEVGGMRDCSPAFFLNGTRLNGLKGEFTSEAVQLIFGTPINAVWAIEIYGTVKSIPGVYSGSELSCGALALWTRQPA